MRKFQIEAVGMGTNNSGYPGAFPVAIQRLIRSVISGKVLHLFSGSSLIGDERIDLNHENATRNVNIREFINVDKRDWDWVILDPPYAITAAGKKLKEYAQHKAFSSDIKFRREMTIYLSNHTSNVLWLDFCAPTIRGFYREKLWLVLPGGYHTVRVLSWLKREMKPLL